MYRAFKVSQQRHMLRKEIMMGRQPMTALQEFDRQQRQKVRDTYGPDHMITAYFK